jgi:hypothetical protein
MRASERSLQFAGGGTLGGQRHKSAPILHQGRAGRSGSTMWKPFSPPPRRLLHLLTVTGALAPASTARSQAPKLPGLGR